MTQISASAIGRHSEYIVMASFIAQGYSVLEPTVPEAYDLVTFKDNDYRKVQIKTIKKRERDGVLYYIIRGTKNSGQVYDLNDCDIFVGVIDGRVFATENREISEYWVKADEVADKWEELNVNINKVS